MDTLNTIRSTITSSITLRQSALEDSELHERIKTVADLIAAAFSRGNRLYLCGNGGSAADAQHIAAEFTGRFYKDRPPLPAEALHVNTSFLTAVANDYDYAQVYERAVKAFGRKGDILISISTSGNSPNVVQAQQEARKREMITISLTGSGGGKLKESCDFLFAVPSTDTPQIQECHLMIGHILCRLVEEILFSESSTT